jgi:hypothetical protein
MGMNCAVMSYNGTMFVGFTGDAHAIPDISSLAVFFSESFAELRAEVNGATPENVVPPAKVKVRKRKPRVAPVPPVDAAAGESAAETELASV